MIILPERGLPRGRVLLPQRQAEWQKVKTRFCITGRLDDGHIVWRGWFDDREDADAFLYSLISGSIHYEKELWRLPSPWWPGLDVDVVYDFVTTRTLLTTSGSNQTDTVPGDWSNVNTIQVIASGGSGGANGQEDNNATGGGGGAYSKAINITLTPNGSVTFRLSAGGSAVTDNVFAGVAGNPGPDAWYNGTTLAGSSVGAKGGSGGSFSDPDTGVSGGAGGLSSGGIGNSTKTSGGNGGNCLGFPKETATGGGGAGGVNGSGQNGNSTVVSDVGAATNGGSGDAGAGGTGGSGSTSGIGGNGGNGAEFGSTGSGAGGGGAVNTSKGNPSTAGTGGNYGGAGGGAQADNNSATSGAGKQGIIFITYTPYIYVDAKHPDIVPRYLRKTKLVGY